MCDIAGSVVFGTTVYYGTKDFGITSYESSAWRNTSTGYKKIHIHAHTLFLALDVMLCLGRRRVFLRLLWLCFISCACLENVWILYLLYFRRKRATYRASCIISQKARSIYC